jgi:tetratricopeptide (TPR) repeat protein
VKFGRNDACPCESGLKYKRCCLPLHETAERERKRLREEPVYREELEVEMEDLTRLTNSVPALIRENRLDEADEACRELQRRYPDQIDFLERRALVFIARGDNAAAAAYYRKAVALVSARPRGFVEEDHGWLLQKIAELVALPGQNRA